MRCCPIEGCYGFELYRVSFGDQVPLSPSSGSLGISVVDTRITPKSGPLSREILKNPLECMRAFSSLMI
jgi:hypothetical protein